MKAIEDKDWDKAASYLSDDFAFIGPFPQPAGRDATIASYKELLWAMPNWRFNVHDVEELPDGRVSARVNITGTQTGQLAVPVLGVPPIAPTRKRIALPEENLIYTLRNGKVSKLEVAAVRGGGLQGILSQLGVALPAGVTGY